MLQNLPKSKQKHNQGSSLELFNAKSTLIAINSSKNAHRLQNMEINVP